MTVEPIKLLLVDDCADDALLIEHNLTDAGFKLNPSRIDTREELETALSENTWQAIICDHGLCSFNGLKALEIVREKDQEVPFIFVSGTIEDEVGVAAMSAGANDYLHKDNLSRLAPVLARELKEAALRKQGITTAAHYQHILDNAHDALIITDSDQHILLFNRAAEQIFGFNASQVMGQPIAQLFAKPDAFRPDNLFGNNNSGFETNGCRANSEHFPMQIRFSKSQHGQITTYMAVVRDISSQKALTEKIEYLAHHDSLTGLLNRYSFNERLEQAIKSARRNWKRVAVLFIDMDNFKCINDTHGHHAGDMVLNEVAQRIKTQVRDSDIVARLGGDEFVLAVTDLAKTDLGINNGSRHEDQSITSLDQIVTNLIETLRKPYVLNDQVLNSFPSIGISLYPEHGEDVDTLLKKSDSAMYDVKRNGKNQYKIFDQAIHSDCDQTGFGISKALDKAIDSGQLELYYQVKVHAHSGQVSGAEALMHWQHPQQGIIEPDALIDLLEKNKKIIPVGLWVIEQACKQHQTWFELSGKRIPIAINFSVEQLHTEKLVSRIASILKHYRVPADQLQLEITESVAMQHPAKAVRVLNAIRKLGVKLALDDFGTGYASLIYLKQLPLDMIKLDKSFVDKIDSCPDDAKICASVLDLAHSLNLEVVAEGVETQKQKDLLLKHGCDYFQGFLFGKAKPAEDFLSDIAEGF